MSEHEQDTNAEEQSPRSLKKDVAALVLCLFTVFLAAALITYDKADSPGRLVFPPNDIAHNACGNLGAWCADRLFTAFGLGAYYLLASLAILTTLLLLRKPIHDRIMRTFGWVLSFWGVCTLMAMVVPGAIPGPIIGAGGYFGGSLATFLQLHFAMLGALVITTSLILGGLLLSSETIVPYLFNKAFGKPSRIVWKEIKAIMGIYRERLAESKSLAVPAGGPLDSAPDTRRPKISNPKSRPEKATDDEEEDSDRRKPKIHKPNRDPESDETADAKTSPDAEETEEEETEEKRSLFSLVRGKKKPKKSEREQIMEELESADQNTETSDYQLPSLELLEPRAEYDYEELEEGLHAQAQTLEQTFSDFGFNVKVENIRTGPVISQFEISLEAGLRLSKITSLSDDLALALGVLSVRIVAPLPGGKNTVGIEVPHSERQLVRLREVIEESISRDDKMAIPVYLGKDVSGGPLVVDLAKMPHLLIAGRTGTGKSVCLNTIIVSMLMTRRPDEVRMLMIDPKMVELSPYKQIPHLMHPVVTDMQKAEAILAWAVDKMEERYQLLAQAGVRHISSYNQLGEEELMERMEVETEEEREAIPRHIPYIVIVADEMADLMMTAAKEVEQHIIRLAQKSRAVGIHLVLATQKPTVDVITGLIKSNLPARIAFQVASRTDSRVVLDEMGADKLLGNGDMLLLWPGTSTLIRGQGTYVEDDEISNVLGEIATAQPQFINELVQLKTRDELEAEGGASDFSSQDELYDQAVEVIISEGRGSGSLLQRALGVGYGRGARLIDFMEEDGVVGPYKGSQAREVLITMEEWHARKAGGGSACEKSTEPEAAKKLPPPSAPAVAAAAVVNLPAKETAPVAEDSDIASEPSLSAAPFEPDVAETVAADTDDDAQEWEDADEESEEYEEEEEEDADTDEEEYYEEGEAEDEDAEVEYEEVEYEVEEGDEEEGEEDQWDEWDGWESEGEESEDDEEYEYEYEEEEEEEE